MGSSLSKSHHHRNYWSVETGQVTGAFARSSRAAVGLRGTQRNDGKQGGF
jgi:hypothetical protein